MSTKADPVSAPAQRVDQLEALARAPSTRSPAVVAVEMEVHAGDRSAVARPPARSDRRAHDLGRCEAEAVAARRGRGREPERDRHVAGRARPPPRAARNSSSLSITTVAPAPRTAPAGSRLDRGGDDEVRGGHAARERLRELALARDVDSRARCRRASSTRASALLALRAKKISRSTPARAAARSARRRCAPAAPGSIRLSGDPCSSIHPREQLGPAAELELPGLEPGGQRHDPRTSRADARQCRALDAARSCWRRRRARARRAMASSRQRWATRRAQRSACGCSERLSVSLPITESSVGRPIAARPGVSRPSRPRQLRVGATSSPRRPGAMRAYPAATRSLEQPAAPRRRDPAAPRR